MTVLNWQNDPIYFDEEPKVVNQWINANELIESNRGKEIFLPDTETLNLFPILVRRADFLRENSTDRILARLPFIQLTEKEKALFKDQELLISEKLRDYFYKSDNRKILEWRDILRKYLERGAVPLPFYRCFPEDFELNFHERILESSRGETFAMPTNLTTELAYLCGMVNGDGNITKYVLNIVDYSIENIRHLKEQFERLFQQTGRIQLQTENCPKLIITNLWVARLFSFLTNQPIGGKKYQNLREPLLFQEQLFRSHYWSGVMDADGSYASRNVVFTSASKNYIQDFISFMKSINIPIQLNTRDDGTFQVYISRKYHELFKSQMKCFHPEKKLEFAQLRKGKKINKNSVKYFCDFDREKISNDFFDFTLMDGVQIVGLGEHIKSLRINKTQKQFSIDFGISPQYLYQLENNKTSISITLLKKFLHFDKSTSLMPFLFRFGKKIKFRRRSAKPVFFDMKPTSELKYYAQKMIFYPTKIKLVKTDDILQEKIENHFGIVIKNNLITNGTIRYFFSTFFIFKEKI